MASALLAPADEVARLGERLVREYTELPAADVLDDVASAFRRAQSWGCPPEHLVATVEASARWGLAQRLTAGTTGAEPAVPAVLRFSPWS